MASKKKRSERPAGPRSVWSGNISFGLVSIPVELFSAHRPQRTSLRMLAPDGRPLSRRYFCPEEDVPVSGDELVRAYEVSKDERVVVTDEELDALEPERSREIALERFVPRDDLPAAYLDRGYYLAPDEGASKPYRLLAHVLGERGRAGIAHFVMRGKAYSVAIVAEDGVLRAHTLRAHDEVRTPADVGLDEEVGEVDEALLKKLDRALKKAERGLDERLLEDEREAALRALIEKKEQAQEDVVAAAPAREASDKRKVIDILEVLKAQMQGEAPAEAGADDLEEASKEELYARAQDKDIPGRSKMSKKQLVKALRAAS